MFNSALLLACGDTGVKIKSFDWDEAIVISGNPVYGYQPFNDSWGNGGGSAPTITFSAEKGNGLQWKATYTSRVHTGSYYCKDHETTEYWDKTIVALARIEILNPGFSYKNPVFSWTGDYKTRRNEHSSSHVSVSGSFAPPGTR